MSVRFTLIGWSHRSEVKKIFDPVIDCIVCLVGQQVTDVTRKGERVSVRPIRKQNSFLTFFLD